MAGLKIGGTDISDVMAGSTQIQKVYQGSNLVWQLAATNPTFVAAYSKSDGSSLSLSGVSTGELIIASASNDGDAYNLTSTGWSSWTTPFPASAINAGIRDIPAYKTMGATPDSSYTVDTTVNVINAAAFAGGTVQSNFGFKTASRTSSTTPPSITVDVDNSTVVMLAYLDDDQSTVSTVPTGYTVAVQTSGSHVSGSNTYTMSAAILYKEGVSAGTEQPSTLGWSSSDDQLIRLLVINP